MPEWNQILADHGPAVWRTVYRLLGHHADALDCYQDTFLAAYRAAERRPVVHWAAFLTSLATRRAVDRLRRRVRSRELQTSPDEVAEAVGGGFSPLDHAQAAEQWEEVRSLLAGLPARQAEVFWLSCVEGLSHAEVGDQLQLGEGAVRATLHRARGRLRAALMHRMPQSRRIP